MSSLTGMMTKATVTPKEGHGTHLATSWQGKQNIKVRELSVRALIPAATGWARSGLRDSASLIACAGHRGSKAHHHRGCKCCR